MADRAVADKCKECHALPPDPLTLRCLMLHGGGLPVGSSGWCIILRTENGQTQVSDGCAVARFWKAHYCPHLDVWIADGPGEQWRDGQITKRFPLQSQMQPLGKYDD